MTSIDYTPTKKQAAFHAAGAYEVLYGGAAGGGKSLAIVMEALIDAMEHPGVHSYLFRRTYPELRDSLLRQAMEHYPPGIGHFVGSSHDFVLPNGSVLHFRACRGMQDCYKYQGAEIHRLYIDELTHFTYQEYDYLKTRLRAAKYLGITPKVRCATNPGGVGHGWVKAYFITPMPPGEVAVFGDKNGADEQQRQTRLYIPATAADNPHLNPGYISELNQKPEALRRALLLGDWNVFEGQVFCEFKDNVNGYNTGVNTHVITPFEIPQNYKIYRGFDWGYTRPFSVGYFAKSPDGVLYRFYEIYGCVPGMANVGLRLPPAKVAKMIHRYETTHLAGRKIIGIADPAIFDESRGEEGCIAAVFARYGVYFERGDNRRLPGKMQLHQRLSCDQNGRAGLYIFSTCRQFLRTLPELVYDTANPEDINTDGEDHIYDETRYVLMANPLPPRPHPATAASTPKMIWSTTKEEAYETNRPTGTAGAAGVQERA